MGLKKSREAEYTHRDNCESVKTSDTTGYDKNKVMMLERQLQRERFVIKVSSRTVNFHKIS